MSKQPTESIKSGSRAAKWRRWTWRSLLILSLIVFGPYLYSRVMAPNCRLVLRKLEKSAAEVPPAEVPSAKDSLRVACYNIAHGRGLAESNWEGGDGAARLERLEQIASLLKEINADVLVLNEVDFDASWSNQVNQAEYLAKACGYRYWVEERNLDFRVLHRTWRFGNAILSKYLISNPELIDLPSYGESETWLAGKKRAFGVELAWGNNDVGSSGVHLVAAHLSHRSEDLRERSAAMIVEHVRQNGLPTVIAGDMNSSPIGFPGNTMTEDGRNAIETFLAADSLSESQVDVPEISAEFTFPSNDPRIVIDWFFANERLRFGSYRVIESELSDHRPIVAEFQLTDIDAEEEPHQ